MTCISGRELYQTSEFKALCTVIGIPHDLLTTGLTISIKDVDDVVRIEHHYNAMQGDKDAIKTETTNLHNENFRTYRARS